jgi:hypothetical protein
MVNMKMAAEKAKEYDKETMSGDKPEYPYGLCLNLEAEQLEKLGITELPAVGAKMMLHANAYVKTVSEYSTQDGTDRRVELQITELDVRPGEGKDPAEIMYGQG